MALQSGATTLSYARTFLVPLSQARAQHPHESIHRLDDPLLLLSIRAEAVATLLEGLQALTPDRSANLEAALWGAAGALAAALVAELFVRVWRWRLKNTAK